MGLKVEKLDLTKVDISGSKWQEVNAEGLEINNVSLANTKINNVNMRRMILNDINMEECTITDANFSNAVIDHVHLFGTEFRNIVLPIEGDGNFKQDGQYKSISFKDSHLAEGQLMNCDLTNMEIIDCDITGLKINGILIDELIRNKQG